MSRVAYISHLVLAAVALVVLIVVGLLLWGLRPQLPRLHPALGGSGTDPVEQAGAIIAWLTSAGCLVHSLNRAVKKLMRAGPPVGRPTIDRLEGLLADEPRAQRRLADSPRQATVQPYRLLIPTRSPDGQGDARPPAMMRSTPPPSRTVASSRSILILGPVKIEGARQPGRRLRSLTAQVLVYIALHPEGATVDQMADSLLPDIDIDRARNRLWQSATEARRVLGDAFKRDQDGRYALDRGSIRIDIEELDRLLDGQQDQDSKTDRLEEALRLFRGVPLAGVDWPWAEHHARNLRTAYVDVLARVGQARLEAGNPRGALSVVERGIQLDELNEALWRLAMRADHATGLRSAVSGRYETLRSRLEQQVGLEPSTETRLLYRDLLGQH